MVANARAIARAAGIAHDSFVEIQFLKIAENLEAAMYEHLWAPEQEFFVCECSSRFDPSFIIGVECNPIQLQINST